MKSLHKKWIVWVGSVLMLICMAIYVLTLDESKDLPLPESRAPAQAVPAN